MNKNNSFFNWMQKRNNFTQSLIFTLPATAAVALVYGLLWATAYPIENKIQGEVTDLSGDTICPESKDECYTTVDTAHIKVGDRTFIVNLSERFQQTVERDRLEKGDIVDITYRSTRDKEFFGSNDATHEVNEYSLIVLSP